MKYAKDCLNRLVSSAMKQFGFSSPVLEVGCGTGETLQFLSGEYDIKGIDLSGEAIAICKKRGLDAYQADLFEVNEEYNSVVCIDVLEHTPDDISFVRHLHKILRKEGKLLVFVPSGKMMCDDLFCGHYRRYSKSAIMDLLKECNFVIEAVEIFGYPVIYYTRILMNLISKCETRQDLSLQMRTTNSSYTSLFDENILARTYYRIMQVPAVSRIISKFLLLSNLGVNGSKGFSIVAIARKSQ